MANIVESRYFRSGLLFLVCLLTLTGCPGSGDRIRFDETTQVSRVGKDVCFRVLNSQGYQPAIISINLRHTPSIEKTFTDDPDVIIKNGLLCISPSFYSFPEKGQFIVEYVLTSKKHNHEPRKFVVTLEINKGRIYNVPPTDKEITRPYNEISEG